MYRGIAVLLPGTKSYQEHGSTREDMEDRRVISSPTNTA